VSSGGIGKEYLTLRDVVVRSGYSDSTVRRAIRRKALKIAKSGVACIRVHVADFENWMRGGRSGKDDLHV
jgi:DNA-directed RNA polymerase specialized sigma54-like protein